MCPLGDEDEETKPLHAHSSNFFFQMFSISNGMDVQILNSWTGADYAYGL